VNYQLSNGATATYLAAQQGHLEILRLLIQDYRGNVKMKAYDGMSSVHAAAQSGHLDCVRFLVSYFLLMILTSISLQEYMTVSKICKNYVHF
jgi:ankyrin repeat protein